MLSVLAGAYIAALLWITLFSRIGNEARRVYPIFSSFKSIFHGDKDALIETVENIILFIPFGFICRSVFGLSRWKTAVLGLISSLLIECTQWLFHLGSFECDDLITNTMGTAIGAMTVPSRINNWKKWIVIFFSTLVLVSSVPFIYRFIQHNHMTKLASRWDVNGKNNLLVLNGESGYTWEGNIYVLFLEDGSIKISGSSDKRSWKLIGSLELEGGKYCFSGLSGVEEKTVAIELEYYDEMEGKYRRLTPDVGPIDSTDFEIKEKTRIKAFVGVYPGADGEWYACPVIYREE